MRMIVEHKFKLEARCPVNDAHDEYDVTVVTDQMIQVEGIIAAAQEIAKEPLYQEDITERLAARYGAEVSTSGKHMSGLVTTTCLVIGREITGDRGAFE